MWYDWRGAVCPRHYGSTIPQNQRNLKWDTITIQIWGGARQRFLTTQWSLIENIKSGEDQDKLLIGFLLEEYWKPVYCYLRRTGHDNEQAKDLTQAFFHEVVLNTRSSS